MRKNFLYRGMMLLAGITAMASCTNDDDIAQNSSRNELDIKVAVQNIAGSRAMVFGQNLPAGSEIGVSVVSHADGGNYDGIATGYTNVAYRATGESTSQTWAASDASKQILLSGTAGKAIAYYPYTADVTDYTAIPVDIATQTDWMYSGEVGPLNDAAPSAEFVMQHALTALNVNFVRDNTYTGAGEVSVLTVTSDGLATNGTFSAVDGAFASTSGAGSAVSIIDAAFTLTSGASNQENPYMFILASDEVKDFTVSATVDGKVYNVGVAMNEAFAPGKMYQLNVKVTNTGLTVSKVTLTDWNIDTTLPDGTLQPEQEIDYSTWVKATYNVTDNSTATQIFNTYNAFDFSTVVGMVVLENDGSRAAGEPESVTPTKTYQFSTTGTHTVFVKFTDMTTIPGSAFKFCNELKEVIIPNSVTTIGASAFGSCKGLTEFNIPESMINIGIWAFYGCTGLTEIVIPNSVTTIGEYAFANCTALKDVTISSGVQTIGEYAFEDCTGLTGELVIPNSVTGIGENAFYGCTGLASVIVPSSVIEIGRYTFGACTGLTEVTIPNSVISIGEAAFASCSSLTAVTIPNSVESIGVRAFEYCTTLSEVTIGSNVTVIGDGAFQGCKVLTEIIIPNSVTTIGASAFYGCYELITVTIPNSVKTIGYRAFECCYELTEVNIPESVTTIGNYAFRLCRSLTGIVIPEAVTEIGERVFDNCEAMKEVTIGSNVTTIGYQAFYCCKKLTTLVIPEAVTEIGEQAFCGCKGLEEVTIGSGVQTIGEKAFMNCNELKKITSYAMIAPSTQGYTFYGVKTSGRLYYPEGSDYSTWTANLSSWTIQEITGE